MDLISDSEMYQFVERGKRGGISSVSKRFDCTKEGRVIKLKNISSQIKIKS